jgi:hypothetical protein
MNEGNQITKHNDRYVNGQLNTIPVCLSFYNVYSDPLASSHTQLLTQSELPDGIHLTSQKTAPEVERHVICNLLNASPENRKTSTPNCTLTLRTISDAPESHLYWH